MRGTIVISTLLVVAYFTIPEFTFAAESDWSDSFESYSVAALGGQGLWAAGSGNVVSSPVQAGSRGFGYTGAGHSIKKVPGFNLQDNASIKIFAFYVRFDNLGAGTDYSSFLFRNTADGATTAAIKFEADGDIHIDNDGASYQDSGLNIGAEDTWTLIEARFDFTLNKFKIRVNGGAWSVEENLTDSAGFASYYINGNAGTTDWYIDSITLGNEVTVAPDDSTRFITFTPELGTDTLYATSTAFTFGATGYINDDDIEEGQYLYIKWTNVTGTELGGSCPSAFGQDQGEIVLEIATTSNEFDVSTTTSITCWGAFTAFYALKNPGPTIFGYTLWDNEIMNAFGQFEVGTTTGGYAPTDSQVGLVGQLVEGGFTTGLLATESNASSTILDLTGYLDLREIMASKFPINWAIFTIATVVSTTNNYSTSTRPATTTIDFSSATTLQWATTTGANLNIPVFSWGWIDTVAQISAWQTLMTLAIGVMYLTLGLLAFKEAQRMFAELRS